MFLDINMYDMYDRAIRKFSITRHEAQGEPMKRISSKIILGEILTFITWRPITPIQTSSNQE